MTPLETAILELGRTVKDYENRIKALELDTWHRRAAERKKASRIKIKKRRKK